MSKLSRNYIFFFNFSYFYLKGMGKKQIHILRFFFIFSIIFFILFFMISKNKNFFKHCFYGFFSF